MSTRQASSSHRQSLDDAKRHYLLNTGENELVLSKSVISLAVFSAIVGRNRGLRSAGWCQRSRRRWLSCAIRIQVLSLRPAQGSHAASKLVPQTCGKDTHSSDGPSLPLLMSAAAKVQLKQSFRWPTRYLTEAACPAHLAKGFINADFYSFCFTIFMVLQLQRLQTVLHQKLNEIFWRDYSASLGKFSLFKTPTESCQLRC